MKTAIFGNCGPDCKNWAVNEVLIESWTVAEQEIDALNSCSSKLRTHLIREGYFICTGRLPDNSILANGELRCRAVGMAPLFETVIVEEDSLQTD